MVKFIAFLNLIFRFLFIYKGLKYCPILYNMIYDDLWYLYGNSYDLSSFLNSHPGGKQILETSRGEHDITPIFESYHQFSDLKNIKIILNKYLVEKNVYKSKYTFHDNGLYKVLSEKIKNYFIEKNIHNFFIEKNGETLFKNKYIKPYIKANNELFFDIISFSSITLICYYYSFVSNVLNFYIQLITTSICGYLCACGLFILMHDASHYAIFKDSSKNILSSYTWNTICLWNNKLWEKHHVIKHHAYTGDVNHDPDLHHFSVFFNKRPEINNIPLLYPFMHVIVFPIMHIGQSLCYCIFHFNKDAGLWKISYPGNCNHWYDIFLYLPFLYIFFYKSLIQSILFIVALNFGYSFCIIGDHDTIETYYNEKKDATDWGEIQVRNSGNFMNNTWCNWFSRLHGGINYQIEHHLFPNICHIYYPEIAPIVIETCKEFNIPYVHHDTLYSVYKSWVKLFYLSNSTSEKE